MKARARVAWNVRRIRVDRGISQERLAYDARIDRSYMGGIEQRIAEPDNRYSRAYRANAPKGATPPKTLRKGRKPARPHRKKK